MRFRLTYEGPLKASQRDPEDGQRDRMAEHKQTIRKRFHAQLKQLWKTNKFLSEYRVDPAAWASKSAVPANQIGSPGFWGGGPIPKRVPLSEVIANLHCENNYRFVPLVRKDFSLLCSLDILFLRRTDMLLSPPNGDAGQNEVKLVISVELKPDHVTMFNLSFA
jgi:hypothetical protein